MGFIMFAILIGSLIVSKIRDITTVKTTNVVSEESEEDYYDDFETL
jgi:hypothetical protein